MSSRNRDTQNAPDEPFELLVHLGTGGFAHTYKARVLDEDLIEDFGAEEVALKIPLNRQKERILRRELEMNASLHLRLKDLQSLNLVRYLGFAVFRGQIVMAMEYIGQGSLRRMLGDIGRQKRLSTDEAVRIAEGILQGLAVIHQEHVFHRDIKPENILMEGRIPKIADLGLARMLQLNELASTTTGTIYYMSPEILGEEGASLTSDIWSVGVTLYEMVTGQLPFGAVGTPIGTMTDLIRRAEPLPPCEVCPEVPADLSDIIYSPKPHATCALSKSPSERYASAEKMYEALKRFRQGSDNRIEQEMAAIRALTNDIEQTNDREAKLRDLVTKYSLDPRAYQYLGEFYNLCQRYVEAIAAFEKGINFNTDNALLHWDLALAYQQIGERDDAARSLEKAMSLGLDASLQRHAATLLKVLQGGRV